MAAIQQAATMEPQVTDIKFMQQLFKRFVLAVISSKGPWQKLSKRPVFKGWLDVTEEQSVELARHADYHDGPFMFLTGKTTEYIAVDLDRRDDSRQDHADTRLAKKSIFQPLLLKQNKTV